MSARADSLPALKSLAFELLVALAGGERHGYALKKEIVARSGGKTRPGPATLYRTLVELAERGLVEESSRRPAPELDDERRRYFRITERGRRALLAEARRMETMVAAARKAVLES